MTDVGGIAADALYHHGIPWLAKKTVEMSRYGASELLRHPNLQKKAVDYGMKNLHHLLLILLEKRWINYQPKLDLTKNIKLIERIWMEKELIFING